MKLLSADIFLYCTYVIVNKFLRMAVLIHVKKLIFVENMLVANRLLVNELIYMHLIRVR